MKNVIIFGAGAAGARVYQHYKNKCNILAFIDNDPGKQNTRLFGVDVISVDAAKAFDAEEIYIASSRYTAIKTQLENAFAGSQTQFIQVKEKFIDPKAGFRAGWWVFFASVLFVYLLLYWTIFARVTQHVG